MIPSPPPATDQVAFLRQIQRLLAEGRFVATYKYALLLAIADLAVTRGDNSGAALTIPTRAIAETVIELYWRQSAPFPLLGGAVVLRQTTSRQAEIPRRLAEAQARYGGSLPRLRQDGPVWRQLVGEVDSVVRKMPLWKLQRAGDHVLDFLYPNVGSGTSIRLRPGVAYCLRIFHDLLGDLVRGAWLRHVRRFNADLLGETADLSAFLFGSERSALGFYLPILTEIQDGRCFYCRAALGRTSEVDHFIPWSRYPTDLGHNFVLAHATCNRRRADLLAAEPHLAAWVERNQQHGAGLAKFLDRARVMHDLGTSVQVARWAYAQVERSGGQAWLGGMITRPLSHAWAALLAG